MEQKRLANSFQHLHKKDNPLILFNIWDSATAQVVVDMGAEAVATSSWSIAAAQGYRDGQNIPFDFFLNIVSRIVSSVNVPVSVDFECGYAEEIEALTDNFKKLIDTGAVGVNFEDQIINQSALQTPSLQANRIEALANTASKSGVNIFLNARTDLFLMEQNAELHGDLVEAAKQRVAIYSAAGANGIFVPGLTHETVISDLCKNSAVPINIMASSPRVDIVGLKNLGVSRISFGPYPFFDHLENFKRAALASISTK